MRVVVEEGPVRLALFEIHRLVSVICLVEAYQNLEALVLAQ